VRLSIVVTDGEQRAALATVRSLGRAGHTVHVCSSRGRSLAGASRYCVTQVQLPDPLGAPDAFAEALVRFCGDVRADVLLPISEAALLAVLPQRERFGCAIPFPSAEWFAAICDKERVLESASAHGLAIPRQHVLQSPAQLTALDGRLQFPVVLKPSRSVAGPASQRSKATVRYASDESELRRTLRDLLPQAFPILLQERIEGPGCAISVLMWNGELRAAFAHRRLREKPPSGGVSVLRESIPLDADLLRHSVALLRDFAWQGVAMVEFKVDARSGTPYLMEINGRLWGSVQLAIDAGVDFPLLLVEAAMGSEPKPLPEYPAGVRTRWELGDLDHLLAILRHSRGSLNLAPSAPGRLQALREFLLGFGPSIHHEVLRADDPGPFFREAVDWLWRR
jgi:predicted ATP-grasp superfamily ATP-dependent carboligase